jgi:hypothetical protein
LELRGVFGLLQHLRAFAYDEWRIRMVFLSVGAYSITLRRFPLGIYHIRVVADGVGVQGHGFHLEIGTWWHCLVFFFSPAHGLAILQRLFLVGKSRFGCGVIERII